MSSNVIQFALKVSANSVYGFTGATVGQLPCLPIASSVTSYGRQLLKKTNEFVEDNDSIAHGYKYDAEVVYEDTDSVFVRFGTTTVPETFPLAIEAAEKCSEIFPNPILLEFEKVYCVGLMWTNKENMTTWIPKVSRLFEEINVRYFLSTRKLYRLTQ